MTLEELAARQGVRQTMAAYHTAGDRLRIDDFVAVFTPDGVLESDRALDGGFRYQGHEEIRAWLAARFKPAAEATSAPPTPGPRPFIRHHLSGTCVIEVTGPDTARASSYFAAYTQLGPDHCGYYLDEFEKLGDAWLIVHRRVRIDWRRSDSAYRNAAAPTA